MLETNKHPPPPAASDGNHNLKKKGERGPGGTLKPAPTKGGGWGWGLPRQKKSDVEW